MVCQRLVLLSRRTFSWLRYAVSKLIWHQLRNKLFGWKCSQFIKYIHRFLGRFRCKTILKLVYLISHNSLLSVQSRAAARSAVPELCRLLSLSRSRKQKRKKGKGKKDAFFSEFHRQLLYTFFHEYFTSEVVEFLQFLDDLSLTVKDESSEPRSLPSWSSAKGCCLQGLSATAAPNLSFKERVEVYVWTGKASPRILTPQLV